MPPHTRRVHGMRGVGPYPLHRNTLFRDRLRPQITVLHQVGTNGGKRSLQYAEIEPCSRLLMLRFF